MLLGNPRIIYSARADATPEAELGALAAIYSLCLQKHRENQKAAGPAPESDSRDAVKESNGYDASANNK